MFTTWLVLAVATLMGSLALYSRIGQENHSEATFFVIISGVILILYIIALIGIYCVDFIYLCYHYYKTMYSEQGYLTHTLPVSPVATFGVKIFTFFVWMLTSSVLLACSVLILIDVASGRELFIALFSSWGEFAREAEDLFGMSAPFLIFIFIAETFLGLLWKILWITASMAIGQLFQSGRAGFSILAGFCIYMVNQIVSTIFLAATGYNLNSFLEGEFRSFMNYVIGGSTGISIVLIVLLYGICVYINKKKLNLE